MEIGKFVLTVTKDKEGYDITTEIAHFSEFEIIGALVHVLEAYKKYVNNAHDEEKTNENK